MCATGRERRLLWGNLLTLLSPSGLGGAQDGAMDDVIPGRERLHCFSKANAPHCFRMEPGLGGGLTSSGEQKDVEDGFD